MSESGSGYSFSFRDGMLVVELHRALSQREIFRVIEEVAEAGSPGRRLWLLGDHLNLNAGEMAEIGDYARARVTGPARVAYVTDDDATFGLTNIHAVYRSDSGYEYGLFRDEQSAIEWLNAGPALD